MFNALEGSSCGPPVVLPQSGLEQIKFARFAITRFTSSVKSSRIRIANSVVHLAWMEALGQMQAKEQYLKGIEQVTLTSERPSTKRSGCSCMRSGEQHGLLTQRVGHDGSAHSRAYTAHGKISEVFDPE